MNLVNKLASTLKGNAEKSDKFIPDKVYSDDVYVVSYPKSGNTWMRFLIGNYLTDNKCSFENCHLIVPDIHMNPDRCAEINRPRFIKSHAPYCTEYPRVVYIVRDGRDVAVSYYHYSLKMGNIDSKMNFSTFMKAFNQGNIGSFGKWGDHVSGWTGACVDSKLLVVRYEDMLDDAKRELRRVLSFAGLETDGERIRSAVASSRFENMQRQERRQQDKTPGLAKSDRSKQFIRKGRKGDWYSYMSKSENNRFVSENMSIMKELKYV